MNFGIEISLSRNEGEKISNNDQAINFSKKITEALKAKAKDHNSSNSKKVSIDQLKKVYVNGASLFDKESNPSDTKALMAMARVNMYLRFMKSESVQKFFNSFNKEISKGALDFTDAWEPSQEDYSSAKKDNEIFDLNYDFEERDLYINEEAFGFEYIKNLL